MAASEEMPRLQASRRRDMLKRMRRRQTDVRRLEEQARDAWGGRGAKWRRRRKGDTSVHKTHELWTFLGRAWNPLRFPFPLFSFS